MADDLADVYAELRRLQEQVRVLMSANPLEKSSVTGGQIRIIAGTIRVDGGGSLIVNGTMSVNGTSTVTGSFTVTGPWNLQGNGTISGAVTITGNVTATGTLTQNGPWNMNGAGNIAGNVTQTGNTDMTGILTLLGGGSIKAGNIEITPSTNGGTIKIGAHSIYVNGTAFTLLHSGGAQVILNSSGVSIVGGGKSLALQAAGASMGGLPTIPRASANNATVGTMYIDTSGQMYRVVA